MLIPSPATYMEATSLFGSKEPPRTSSAYSPWPAYSTSLSLSIIEGDS